MNNQQKQSTIILFCQTAEKLTKINNSLKIGNISYKYSRAKKEKLFIEYLEEMDKIIE